MASAQPFLSPRRNISSERVFTCSRAAVDTGPRSSCCKAIAIEQARGGRRIHRAIAAVNVFAQQRAGLVAVDTDAVPAVVDGLGIFVGDARRCRGDHRLRSLSAARSLRAAQILQSSGARRVTLGLQQGGQVHQRVGMLRFEVQRLAIKALGFEDAAGDIAEQPQPVEHLGHRFVAGANNFSHAARASALCLRWPARRRSPAARRRRRCLRQLTGSGDTCLTLANGRRCSRHRRHPAHGCGIGNGVGTNAGRGSGSGALMATEGKGLRDTNRAHAQAPQQSCPPPGR